MKKNILITSVLIIVLVILGLSFVFLNSFKGNNRCSYKISYSDVYDIALKEFSEIKTKYPHFMSKEKQMNVECVKKDGRYKWRAVKYDLVSFSVNAYYFYVDANTRKMSDINYSFQYSYSDSNFDSSFIPKNHIFKE
jgi:hypothetical protein